MNQSRPEVLGIIEISQGAIVLRCWPHKHCVGEVRQDHVLRIWDRRCKKYVLFLMRDIEATLQRLDEEDAASRSA